MLVTVSGIVVPGTQGASGLRHCQEVGGSIRAQREFFIRAGVDMERIYPGTINVSIAPHKFRIVQSDYEIRGAKWNPHHEPEDFSLVHCTLRVGNRHFDGYVYFPHPDTKIGSFPGYSVVEVLTSFVPGLRYGMRVLLWFRSDRIRILPQGVAILSAQRK